MTGPKRPSTSSLRRFINSRPYVALSEIRRRFGLEEDAVTPVSHNGTLAYVGLPEREALKVADLWQRGEIGLEFSVEVRASVVIGVYPMRIARYVQQPHGNGAAPRPQLQNGAPRQQRGPSANGARVPDPALESDRMVARPPHPQTTQPEPRIEGAPPANQH